MQLIGGILSTIGAAFAAFLLHIAAHDFCAASPTLCKRLIVRAARKLNTKLRERYEEEWLADLEERETLFCKFKHAFECVFCARKIARQAAMTTIHISYFVPGVGRLPIDMKFGRRTAMALLNAVSSKNAAVSSTVWLSLVIYFVLKAIRSAARNFEGEALDRFTNSMNNLLTFDYEIKIQIGNNRHFDLTRIAKAYFKDPARVLKIIDDFSRSQTKRT